MKKGLKVLGIITARGGSKGIPKKNIAPLLGRPLLAWTVEAAFSAKLLDRVVLSTDDEEIAEIGRNLGVEVPFLRPVELALDDTRTIDVLQDVIRKLEQGENENYDAIFTLQPTNPLRLPSDIDGAIRLMERTNSDSVIGFCEVGEKHPARMKEIDPEGWVHDPPFCEVLEGLPRQHLPRYYLRDGSVYLTKKEVIMQKGSIRGEKCQAWIIPQERALNIDTPFDLWLAEQLIKRMRGEEI